MSGIRLVVGLGNPGRDYERTRHNAGFWLLENYARRHAITLRKDNRYQAILGRDAASGAYLLMPQSFMNASGRATQMLAHFLKIAPSEILVVHDELDLPAGSAKMKQGGGIAGHNGIRDISQRLGSLDTWRLRIGIGHPRDREGPRPEVVDYVLQRPSPEDQTAIDSAIDRALDILPLCFAGDMQAAMMKLHTKAQGAGQ
jgi:PTH1 family peptidyl-tRNA hydrolase